MGKNFLTREREKFDICENCCVTDLEDEDQMGLSGGHEEYLDEAREWLEEIKKLAGLAKDEKWYQKRLNTLEWLIQQTEEAEKLEAKVEQYEKSVICAL